MYSSVAKTVKLSWPTLAARCDSNLGNWLVKANQGFSLGAKNLIPNQEVITNCSVESEAQRLRMRAHAMKQAYAVLSITLVILPILNVIEAHKSHKV